MWHRSARLSFLMLACGASTTLAGELPAIKTNAANHVPACATPERLMAFAGSRNPKLDARFASVAEAYKIAGERLNIRWDYAFYQMMVETGSLAFAGDNGAPSVVRASQNNFAKLGSAGDERRGEKFRDVATGALAHLQHLQLYAGDRVEAPAAERTRKVQEWDVLGPWQKALGHPTTYRDLAEKWAPGNGKYADEIAAVAQSFEGTYCKGSPAVTGGGQAAASRTDATAAVAAGGEPKGREQSVHIAKVRPATTGTELARKAIERAKEEGGVGRSALGAGSIAASVGSQVKSAAAAPQEKAQRHAVAPAVHGGGKCRVLTASYGGSRSVIIRHVAEHQMNYVVLGINETDRVREIDAFVSAYAPGGESIGEYAGRDAALDEAFRLCPES
jgi:hypothetical protein